jgi:hypothetical protein
MIQFKQAEIEQANGFGLMMQGLNQYSNNPRQRGSRILIDFEPSPQFLPDLQTEQTGFSCGPEEIFFPRKVTEDRDFANPCQSGDLMSTAGRESLA